MCALLVLPANSTYTELIRAKIRYSNNWEKESFFNRK